MISIIFNNNKYYNSLLIKLYTNLYKSENSLFITKIELSISVKIFDILNYHIYY